MVVELSQLWLPILLSGVAVFFLGFLMWMVFPHHRSDWRPLPDEDRVMKTLRELGVGGGQYTFPHCSGPAQMKDPEWIAKYNAGPKGFLVLKHDGPESMGKSMMTSFLFNVITAMAVAYVACQTLSAGAEGLDVFRFTGTVAFMTNSFGLVWGAIWFGRTWSSTLKEMGDGFAYSVVTALLFMAFWPGA